MEDSLKVVRQQFVQGMGEISRFWSFSPVMGRMYGLLYLSNEALTADAVGEALAISKGNVSMNLRNLDRWGMIRKTRKQGDRKEYYEAEPNFIKIVVNILSERRNREFDRALSAVGECLERIKGAAKSKETAFIKDRLTHMEQFFKTLDASVMTLLKLVGKGA
jgi:DNA-binding transcriptional regulator GbsR (MarR family)